MIGMGGTDRWDAEGVPAAIHDIQVEGTFPVCPSFFGIVMIGVLTIVGWVRDFIPVRKQ